MSVQNRFITSHEFGRLNLRPWRLNLMTSFQNSIYIAVHDHINVYNDHLELKKVIPILKAKNLGYATKDTGTDEFGATINQIISGYCGSLACIVAIIDDGGVILYDVLSLDKPLYYFNEVSCWGVDIHSNGLLAVSNNNHKIKVWKIANCKSSSSPSSWLSEIQTKYMPFTSTDVTDVTLSGHTHNVPCISISTCGSYIVSASIDKTCRIWHITNKQCIAIKEVSSQWGWLSKCLPKECFKPMSDDTLEKSIFNDIQAAISTSYPALNRTNPSELNQTPQTFQEHHQHPRTVRMDASQFQFMDHDTDDSVTDTESVHSSPSVESEYLSFEVKPSAPHEFKDLILFGSKYDLFLFELDHSDFKMLYSCSNIVRGLQGRRQVALLDHFDRLCILQTISELGVIIVASQQGSGSILQLNVSVDRNKYYYKTISTFHGETDSPLAGISVLPRIHLKFPFLSYYLVYILYLDGTMKTHRLDIKN